jgi:transcriptional regulator with XRE-family HTH domain
MAANRSEALKKIGGVIKLTRNEKGLTQEEFSNQIDMNRSYLGGIERGERNITLENLLRISTALKLKMWELFKKGNL